MRAQRAIQKCLSAATFVRHQRDNSDGVHVVPMVEKTDINSARYIVSPSELHWGSDHLLVNAEVLQAVREELAFSFT